MAGEGRLEFSRNLKYAPETARRRSSRKLDGMVAEKFGQSFLHFFQNARSNGRKIALRGPCKPKCLSRVPEGALEPHHVITCLRLSALLPPTDSSSTVAACCGTADSRVRLTPSSGMTRNIGLSESHFGSIPARDDLWLLDPQLTHPQMPPRSELPSHRSPASLRSGCHSPSATHSDSKSLS